MSVDHERQRLQSERRTLAEWFQQQQQTRGSSGSFMYGSAGGCTSLLCSNNISSNTTLQGHGGPILAQRSRIGINSLFADSDREK